LKRARNQSNRGHQQILMNGLIEFRVQKFGKLPQSSFKCPKVAKCPAAL